LEIVLEHLDHPTLEQWSKRRDWFEAFIFSYEEAGSYLVGEQACAIISDVQSCFCSGAWAATIVLAFSVIEANLQETNETGKKQRSVDLLSSFSTDTRFDLLRKRRNSLIHATPNNPAITTDQQWDNRASLEFEAKEAIELMFIAFYSQIGT
jgi:hypothetical protein